MRAAVAVAQANGLSTIAEHVEDAETDRCMRDLGVDWGQGYFYGKPVPLRSFLSNYAPPARAP